jgi:iron complex transport system permease protein
MLVLFLILLVAQRFRGMTMLLIFGLMLNYVLGALITILQAEAKQDALQQFVFWGMGTFGQNTLLLATGLIVLVGLVSSKSWFMRKNLDAWTLGEITARSMGVSQKEMRWNLLLLTGLTTGAITAICGPVAFLGLATPHVVRAFSKRRTHGFLIPMTALCGAGLALLADWGVKGFGGVVDGWPLNAVLSLLGGPMVIWVLIKRGWTPE